MADPSPPVIARVRIEPARLDEIERRLLRAEAAADFVPLLATEWGRSKRRVWDYVARVRKRLAERAAASKLSPEADSELVRALMLRAYRVAEEKGDAKGMTGAARNLGEMTGVIGPRRVELSGPGGSPLMTPSALDELMRREFGHPGAKDLPDGRASAAGADDLAGEALPVPAPLGE